MGVSSFPVYLSTRHKERYSC